jgi:hypothetical protein
MGTYQNKKIREKRIKQVKTKSPIKILFLGLMSNVYSADCRMCHPLPNPPPSRGRERVG